MATFGVVGGWRRSSGVLARRVWHVLVVVPVAAVVAVGLAQVYALVPAAVDSRWPGD